MTHPNDLVPTSSPRRPTPGDDLGFDLVQVVPTSTRDEVELTSTDDLTENTTTSSPGTTSTRPFITTRTHPFWTDVRNLLNDNTWHPRAEIQELGKKHHLADRTIANLLPRAAKRQWIRRSHGHIQIRDQAALDAALDLKAGRP